MRGDPTDRDLLRTLFRVLAQSRKDETLFRETATTIAKLGNVAAVPEFLKYLGGRDRVLVAVILNALPDLLVQVNEKKPLETSIRRLIDLHEESEAVAHNRPGKVGMLTLTREDYRAIALPARTALFSVTGQSFDTAAGFRAWWNIRENRERFLKKRTGR